MAWKVEAPIDFMKDDDMFESVVKAATDMKFRTQNDALEFLRIIERIERKYQDFSQLAEEDQSDTGLGNIYRSAINYLSFLLRSWVKIVRTPSKDGEKHEYFLELCIRLLEALEAIPHGIENVDAFLDYLYSYINRTLRELESMDLFSPSEAGLIENKFYEYLLAWRLFAKSRVERRLSDKIKAVNLEQFFSESEQPGVGVWDMQLYINTKDAVRSNQFMHLITSTLGYIDDLEVILVHAEIGSYFQRLYIRFKNIFSRRRTKEILEKSVKAAESYALDKHIAPVQKTYAEAEKISEEIKRMATPEQMQEITQLTIEKMKQDVVSQKIDNALKALELDTKLSERFGREIVQIDDDYRITLNNILMIEQIDKKITIGKIEDTQASSE